jgi:uncharacterized membrane protein
VFTGNAPLPMPGPGGSAPLPARSGGPVARRIGGVDVARGAALIGIVIINIVPTDGDAEYIWTLFGGRAAALFALIAGISIALQSGGRRSPSGRAMTASRAALALRGLMILSIGLLLGRTETPPLGTAVGIILPYYGILFLLAVPLLSLGRRTLLALAVVFAVLGPVAMQLIRAWWPDRPQVDGEYTFSLAAAHPGTFLTDMLFTGTYPALPWLAYICVGLAVGRLDLTLRKVGAVLLAAGTALAAAMWGLSVLLLGPGGGFERLVAATPQLNGQEINQIMVLGESDAVDDLPATTGWWLAILAPHTSTPITILSSLGTALAVLGAILLLVPYLGRTTAPLAAAGTMTLTLYSAHIIILATGILNEKRPIMSITIQCIIFVLAAVLWHNAVGKGPLEAVIATATGWLRTLVLTGHRPATPTNEGAQEPAPSTGSSGGAGHALRGRPKSADGQGSGTPGPREDQDRDPVSGRAGQVVGHTPGAFGAPDGALHRAAPRPAAGQLQGSDPTPASRPGQA